MISDAQIELAVSDYNRAIITGRTREVAIAWARIALGPAGVPRNNVGPVETLLEKYTREQIEQHVVDKPK